MADKPYRFLFRMPEQLRQRLVASAEENGRSLNSELLHRLEQSLAAEARVPLMARFALAVRAIGTRAYWSRSVPRAGAAVALGLTAVVAAVGVSSLGGGSSPRSYDLAPPNGAVVRVPFPAIKHTGPVRVRASRVSTGG